MIQGITSENLFPTSAIIHFRSEISVCATCHEALKVMKTDPVKKAATLAIGNFIGHDLIPFLEHIKQAYGVPLAIVSDMGKGIALAIKEVFKNIPTFICHFHFLKAIGKNLFGDENDIIRKKLKKHNVRVILRRTKKRLETIIADTTDLVPEIVKGIEHEILPAECPLGSVPAVVAYTLISLSIRW